MSQRDNSHKEMAVASLMYALPPEAVAHYPLAERDQSKLLLYRNGEISETGFVSLAEHLPEAAMLVFNNTKVIPARLHFQNPTGATIEVFCLEPKAGGQDPGAAVAGQQSATWLCMVRNGKKWKVPSLRKEADGIVLEAKLLGREDKLFVVELSWTPAHLSMAEVLQKFGELPIPPYFDRDTEEIDKLRYQTVYAGKEGSVAAPTAGLHFTERVFESLEEKGIQRQFLTLHVGGGTFMPLMGEKIGEHEMHPEWLDVEASLIAAIIQQLKAGKLVVSVGTTTLRSLESLYWMGLKAMDKSDMETEALEVHQWDPYELPLPEGRTEYPSAIEALESLLLHLQQHQKDRIVAKTRLMITPGYRLKVAKALITNFHLPGSSLLLLIGAFLGEDWRRVYAFAIANNFRFFSYGDSSLLFSRQ